MNFFEDFEKSISRIRFDSYRLAGKGDHDAVCKYLWNISLCESLYPVLQFIEVSFRNVLHGQISAFVGEDWIKKEGAIKEVSFLREREREKIKEAKEALASRGKQITESYLIAELSFGFWISILDAYYDRMWHKIIQGVFPGMPRTIRTRGEASSRMSKIRNLRNAALHHHSIWHWKDLQEHHRDILQILGWICPNSQSLAEKIDRFPTVISSQEAAFASIVSELVNIEESA